MKLPKNDDKKFEMCPAGSHLGICVGLIDLGTQETNGKFGTKHQRKILIQWEIPAEKMEDGRPFMVSNRYTLSGYIKATLMRDLNGWRGIPFTEEDFETFDLECLLGKACTLNLIHQPVGDKVYCNVNSVGTVMKGLPIPAAENPIRYFSFDDPDIDVFNELPEWIQNVIRLSPELRALEMKEIAEEDKAEKSAAPVAEQVAEVGDVIPF